MTSPAFHARASNGTVFRDRVARWFSDRGVHVAPYGQEATFGPSFHESLVACGADLTARYLRYRPDLALVVIARKSAFLCETKAGSGQSHDGRRYQHFTYEVDSFLVARAMAKIGVRIFVVFGDLTAAWVSQLRFDEIIVPTCRGSLEDRIELCQFYQREIPDCGPRQAPVNPGGSGTPFGKVPRSLFRPLGEFCAEIIDAPPPDLFAELEANP
jgi:hypothetical protein